MATAQDVMTETAAILNDPSQATYTNTVLLPFIAKANRELQLLLENGGIPTLKEISTPLTVLTGAVTVALPVDFIEPIKLEERALGSTALYSPMYEQEWEPNASQDVVLLYWTWREEALQFLGATTDRQVKLYYRKTLNPLTSAGSTLAIADSQTWLAIRLAQLIAKHIMNSPTLAIEMKPDVDEAKDQLIRRLTKNMQGVGARRLPYRGYGRRVIR